MFLIGFGIFGLIASGFAFGDFTDRGQLLGWAICVGLVPVPMIVTGIWMVRRVEDAELASEMSSATDECESINPTEVEGRAASGGFLDNVRAFELNQLNWLGWLLFLATFGFVLACCLLAGFVAWEVGWSARVVASVVALPVLLLAVGFFKALEFLFGLLGMKIYRDNASQNRAGPTKDPT